MVDVRFSNIYSRHTNNSYVENQTEQLCSKVKKLKYITVQISDEIKRQNADLTKYQKIMNLTSSLIDQAHHRVKLLSQSGWWKMYLYLILFSLFIFLIIYSFTK
ncbi:unnamed protein product [Rotaria sordida]|uniref:t-SNARE coiled-coil homology domain-containing protein n=1 Tax=Rotaria sordida TaxID=392033 RepID=A0A814PTG2_9BILA|nr:unnamed protein product [Rotaria sordida]CAF3615574.1 unnamed protein product [Rotaria sordida]